ncbi:STM3941 family protein [Chryseobacterium shigense]|uniref:Uncharacterized protein n=1 Tax=Chryseobacterium shigense TaxID=297244 RepID=A0A841NKK5_9FLAO|nr:STM3941 family protein [Chryseobacterium shigense]MBB6371315.1 hypothetical protein [Chryseobacterium shigense]
MKLLNGKTIIYKDDPATGSKNFGIICFSLLFIITTIWIIGLFSESFWDSEDDIIFCLVLFVLDVIFFRILLRFIRSATETNNENPLVIIEKSGITIYDTPFNWKDIEKITLCNDIGNECKYILIDKKNKHKQNFNLNSMEVSEFMNLSKFQRIIKPFFENIEIQ